MRAWDSIARSDSLRPGPAALIILLIAALFSISPLSLRLEHYFYDRLAAASEQAGSRQVVMVDTRSMGEPGQSLWESSRLPDLLTVLQNAGARVVLPVEPAPPDATLPDATQLARLAEIEERRTRDPADDAKGEAFERQLTALQQQAELRGRIVGAASEMRNLLLSVATTDGAARSSAATGCGKHLLDPESDAAAVAEAGARRTRPVAPPPASLCDASTSAGHVEFWADDDGVLRHADLIVNAAGQLVPSAALRAAMSLEGPPPESDMTSDAAFWDSDQLPTPEDTRLLLRFYSGDQPRGAFDTIAATDLLQAADPSSIVGGRIVVLGHANLRDREPGYITPMHNRVTPSLLTATTISNIVQGDFRVRPGWLAPAEVLLLGALSVAALLLGLRAPPAVSLMTGLIIAVLLLAAEAYLVIARGLWAQLATTSVFTLASVAVMLPLRIGDNNPLRHELPSSRGVRATAQRSSAGPDDELDMAFSMLRHQPPGEQVKEQLYDLALEHARRKELAKAERVLRHLVSLDASYRKAGEKLQRLAGMRQAAAPKSPTSAQQASPPAAKRAPPDDALTGRVIGRYNIEQPIGRGAMATVYLGHDPKINRSVAIKTIALAEEFSDADLANARAQFLREAESAGRLNHPNIISIYDAGEDGSVAYLAMEYFPGLPLSHYAQQAHLLPAHTVLELMARAAEALHYAHSQRVVHRDVKPANLLYDAGSDTLKITDFGIARLTDSSRTKTGIILGTPSYMSPEQLNGTNVTGQSDLFSLGVTLYQLLAGAPPFRADSIPQLMQKIAREQHPRICSLRPELPSSVDAILDRALAKDPAERFPNGRAMAMALRDCCGRMSPSAVTATQ